MRSRFSRSTTLPLPAGNEPETLGDVFRLFHDLKKHLTATTGKTPKAGSRLRKGPAISEYVFKSRGLRLVRSVEIGFAFTLWYFDRDREPDKKTIPDVAEISIKWEIEERDSEKAAVKALKPIAGADEAERREKIRLGATRALSLFTAMQKDFSGWIDKDNASKTKLGLPKLRK
jgi:hypothetical protein